MQANKALADLGRSHLALGRNDQAFTPLTYAVTRYRMSEERLDLSQSPSLQLRQTLALLTTESILVAIFPGAM